MVLAKDQAADRKLRECLKRLTVRARVALALAASERVAPIISSKPPIEAALMSAIDLAWQWASGQEVKSRQMYDTIHVIESLVSDWEVEEANELSVVNAVGLAIYYTVWHAYTRELLANEFAERLHNDIYDVTEGDLFECLDSARRASDRDEAEWQAGTVAKLLKSHATSNASDLGSGVTRDLSTND